MPGHFTFYCKIIKNGIAAFDEVEFKHAIQVLRYGLGSEIWFTNGGGFRFRGEISAIERLGFLARVIEEISVPRPGELHLNMAILKTNERMEWAIEKCTELAATSITLFQSDRGERSKVNVERLQKVMLTALKQSHGAWLPTFRILNFQQAIAKEFCLVKNKCIAFCGDIEKVGVKSLNYPLAFLIGPEGDFSEKEINEALGAGWIPLDLGKQILRTETAAVSVVAAVRLNLG